MSRNIGMSLKVGRPDIKSNIRWIEYEINWLALAKSNCKTCYGRGYEGYEPQTEEEKESGAAKNMMMCGCVAYNWSKMTDEERLVYATRKENADEVVAAAKAEIAKVAVEIKAEEAEQTA